MRPSPFRRYLECAVFVGVWMAVGWVFRLDGLSYNIVGTAMGLIFQRFVARRPLVQVWVREAERPRLDRRGILVAGVLALLVAVGILWLGQPHRWSFFLPIAIGCSLPSLLVAFAMRAQSPSRLRQALPWFGLAALVGCGAVSRYVIFRTGSFEAAIATTKLTLFLPNFGLMFVAGFLVEEVVFRGVLDSHVTPASGGAAAGWMSAIFVAVLWTVWHLPAELRTTPPNQLTELLVFRAVTPLVGVPLSFCWRRGGTLVLPAAAHALINAYRSIFVI